MTVNTVYLEGRMGCFSLHQFSNISPSFLLSRSSPLSLSFGLFSFLFSPFYRFHSPSPFSHPSPLSRFHSPSPLFPPFLSPILLLSPVFTLLPPFPALPLSHPSHFTPSLTSSLSAPRVYVEPRVKTTLLLMSP